MYILYLHAYTCLNVCKQQINTVMSSSTSLVSIILTNLKLPLQITKVLSVLFSLLKLFKYNFNLYLLFCNPDSVTFTGSPALLVYILLN